MKNYNTYTVDKFILDSSFGKWVLKSPPDLDDFWQNWAVENPNKIQEIERSKKIILAFKNAQEEILFPEIEDSVAQIVNIAEQENRQKSTFLKFENINFRKLSAAAALLLAPILGWILFSKNTFNTLAVQNKYIGTSRKIEDVFFIDAYNHSTKSKFIALPDGSTVVLLPQSKLRYPSRFNADKREISLTGEAFFEVFKNSKQPFFVDTGEVIAKVLGTSFTINTLGENGKTQLWVKTGKVFVFRKTKEKKQVTPEGLNLPNIALTPNQQVVFLPSTGLFIKSNIGKNQLLALPQIQAENFNFKRATITDVFHTIEQAYGVHIIYDPNAIILCELTADLGDEPLLEKISLICKVIDANYKYADGQIIITGKGCGTIQQ